mgnify:CR=1 FL=1
MCWILFIQFDLNPVNIYWKIILVQFRWYFRNMFIRFCSQKSFEGTFMKDFYWQFKETVFSLFLHYSKVMFDLSLYNYLKSSITYSIMCGTIFGFFTKLEQKWILFRIHLLKKRRAKLTKLGLTGMLGQRMSQG